MKTYYTTESTITKDTTNKAENTSTDTRAFYRLALRVKYAQQAITEHKARMEKNIRLSRLVCYV